MLYSFMKLLAGWFLKLLFIQPGKVPPQYRCTTAGPAIIICNHIGRRDPMMLAVHVKQPLHFMAKKELFSNKLAAFFLRALHIYPVNRHTADMQSVKYTLDLLKNGKIVVIFPEGTRSKTGELQAFENGVAFLSLRADVPVIPVQILRLPGDRKEKVYFGEAVLPTIVGEMAKPRRVEALTEILRERMLRLRADILKA